MATSTPSAESSRGTWLGIFSEPEQVFSALDRLHTVGFSSADVEVLSGTPYPSGTFGEPQRPHHLYTFAFGGAILGLVVGLLVTIGTQISYPMVTGGKPILAIPAMINVLYEATLLGAIIFTVIGAVLESRLPDLKGVPYDPRPTEGCLGLVVRYTDRPSAARAERELRAAGALDLVGNGGAP